MDLLLQKLVEQIFLVIFSVSTAIFIGIILAISFRRAPRCRSISLAFVSVLQTIPSLALLAVLLPFFGIGLIPALIALTLYAVLPIFKNAVTGFAQISNHYLEAAKDLGANPWQTLWMIEMPLALPFIMAGIRIAVSMTVGVATIATFIGAGGLGDFIARGLAMNNNQLLMKGAIPAALMALILDGFLAIFEKKLSAFKASIIWIIFALLIILGFTVYKKNFDNHFLDHSNDQIVIGSKNFTEQYILGEIIAQLIESKTHLRVVRILNLGSTDICTQAMKRGNIDIYPEYTGTAYMTVMHQKNLLHLTPEEVYQQVKNYYQNHLNIIWFSPLGFSNSQSLTVTRYFSNRYHVTSISDISLLAQNLILGAPLEFLDREDGYSILKKVYHLRFKKIIGMDPGIMYRAISTHQLDVINAFTTDGRILANHLYILKDDKHAFPPYQAAYLVRNETIKLHPELIPVITLLSNQFNDETMQKLNAKVDIDKKSPAEVAHAFLIEKHLISVV